MAVRLAESLSERGAFEADDVLARYLDWYQEVAFDTGPVAEKVFARIVAGDQVDIAVRFVHKERGGLTAGCNPAHRSPPLALTHYLADDKLPGAAFREAALTHFDSLAMWLPVPSCCVATSLSALDGDMKIKKFDEDLLLNQHDLITDPYAEVMKYYKQKDYDKAFPLFRQLAEQGHAFAQMSLGIMYANGYGVTQDDEQAVFWYRKAAEQGHVFAQSNLGYMYANGRGVAQNNEQAVFWYRKAAKQGNANAIAALNKLSR
jgi:tetratricopeptide (TPR) repeat protein